MGINLNQKCAKSMTVLISGSLNSEKKNFFLGHMIFHVTAPCRFAIAEGIAGFLKKIFQIDQKLKFLRGSEITNI